MKKRTQIAWVAILGIGIVTAGIYWMKRPPEIRHIILISIDTCRADYLSCYGYPRNTTPNIDAVAEHATRFEHVVSPVPITLPAHCSMLTGTIPPFHGVHGNIGYQLAPSNLTLAEILHAGGFGTAAIISSFVLDEKLGLGQGFDTYHDEFNIMYENKFGNERKGDETTRVALEWLDNNRDKQSFLFLHYYDPHIEYDPPEPYASDYADNLYAGEIAFTDHCIGQVIQKLRELDLYDSTLLIITGDHGEMLGEHGELEHTYFIYESAIRVPLVIKLPGQKKGAVVSQPVGLVDLVPTICSLLDIELTSSVQGRDIKGFLMETIPDQYERNIYSESITPTRIGASSLMAISAGRWKYIQAPRPELYDVIQDPGEQTNLIQQEYQRSRILEDQLQRIVEESIRKESASRIDLDAESIRRLQSLGYVAGNDADELQFDKDKEDPKDLIQFYVQFQQALTRFAENDFDQSKIILHQLIPQRPDFFELYLHLGFINMSEGRFEDAIDHYRRVLVMEPDQPQALNNLAWIQATRPSLKSSDADEALRHARELNRLSQYQDPNALDTLAVCYAAAGDFPNAVKTARKAQALAAAANDRVLAQKIAARLALFEQSKPYVEE